MLSVVITLYFGDVSFIPVKPSLVTCGACVFPEASIS